MEELEEAFNKIMKGIDPTEDEPDSGSDSCPSEDNLDLRELYKVIYLRRKIRHKELREKETAEKKYF